MTKFCTFSFEVSLFSTNFKHFLAIFKHFSTVFTHFSTSFEHFSTVFTHFSTSFKNFLALFNQFSMKFRALSILGYHQHFSLSPNNSRFFRQFSVLIFVFRKSCRSFEIIGKINEITCFGHPQSLVLICTNSLYDDYRSCIYIISECLFRVILIIWRCEYKPTMYLS